MGVSNMCEICASPILQMAFRGTGVCGENCRKERERRRTEMASLGAVWIEGKRFPVNSIEWSYTPEELSKEAVALLYGGTVVSGGNGAAQLAQGSVERAAPQPTKGARKHGFLRRSQRFSWLR
jgi:hypothetical protein